MSDKLNAVHRLIDSWRRRSVEEFLDCLTDDIEYHYHMGSPPVHGKAKMRKFLANYAAAYEQREWKLHAWAENGAVLLVEGYEELYDTKYSRIIEQPFMQAYEFRGDMIAKLRDYYEPSKLRPPAAETAL